MKQDGRLPFGQLPALQVDDQLLVQSAAILRFVGKLANLYPTGSGSDDIYAAKIDAAMDEEADMFVGLSVSRYKGKVSTAPLQMHRFSSSIDVRLEVRVRLHVAGRRQGGSAELERRSTAASPDLPREPHEAVFHRMDRGGT
jgi:hypothetical protein